MGISVGHNRGASISIDGVIRYAISNERLTRIKTDRSDSIPVESMRYCISALGISYEDIDLFVYNTTEDTNNVEAEFTKETGLSTEKLQFLPHHLAHAFSVFCASGFDESAVIVADAMGSVYNDKTPIKEWFKLDESLMPEDGRQLAEGYSIYHFSRPKNQAEAIYTKWVPYPMFDTDTNASIGFMYGTGTRQLVYSPRTHTWQAGKLMGLASYAEPAFMSGYESPLILEDMDMQVSAELKSPHVNHESDFQAKANAAGMYQYDQETASLHLAKMAKNMTGSDHICAAGGSFLNCNTNEAIIKSGMFEDCYFLHAADDSGIPIGLAYYGYSFLTGKMPMPELEGRNLLLGLKDTKVLTPYLGREYAESEIEEAFKLVNFRMSYFRYDFEADLIEAVANLLSENKVVAWFQGGSEMGPRALGNRSILASPKYGWMTNYINSEIKHREWYRPFAPSVLFERQGEIFDLDTYSPYMLVTAKVKPEWQAKIPAVTHHDGTARYQSVTELNNPKYHALISSFADKTGIPVLLNTSFNGPEEPIVETPLNALNTFYKQGIHAIALGNYLIIRESWKNHKTSKSASMRW